MVHGWHRFFFFFFTAALTEQQHGQTYVRLSRSSIIYKKLWKRWEKFISNVDAVFARVVRNMLKKRNDYLLEMAMDQD